MGIATERDVSEILECFLPSLRANDLLRDVTPEYLSHRLS